MKKIFVDLDGTISYNPQEPGFADRHADYDLTKKQLDDWGVKYTDLQVGNKPHFDMYICDKSYNSETYFHRVGQGLP